MRHSHINNKGRALTTQVEVGEDSKNSAACGVGSETAAAIDQDLSSLDHAL